MPKNTATDTITDQEMAFAHLILSATMTDRRAAEAVGLNPESAAHTKAKPGVRAYMIELRAVIRERLVDQEADLSPLPRQAEGPAVDGLRMLNFGRDQILNRLWELATLSHEATRGSIVGQMKALAMIAAIEGLIPDRRPSPSRTQPAAPPVEADIYAAGWLPKQQHQAASGEPGDAIPEAEAQSAAPPPAPAAPRGIPEPEPTPNLPAPPPPSRPDSLITQAMNWVPQATGRGFEALLDSRQPFSIKKGRFGRRYR
jgi:hypothetical protein